MSASILLPMSLIVSAVILVLRLSIRRPLLAILVAGHHCEWRSSIWLRRCQVRTAGCLQLLELLELHKSALDYLCQPASQYKSSRDGSKDGTVTHGPLRGERY